MAAAYPEGAAEYLSNTNFKSLMEWMTAEMLFHRPEDPLAFVKAIVTKKLTERGSDKYNPADNDKYLQECYEDPSVGTESKSGEAAADDSALTARLEVLEKLIKASRAIAMKLDPFEATESIIRECCNILEADRATLFKLDEGGKELELMVAEGAKSIFLPVGQGIAGTVAATAETINIPDAYSDSRFDPSHDQATGYKTRTILCSPVRDGLGNTVGVIQAINKSGDGPFNSIDEEILGILAAQAGIALRNAELYHISVRSREKVRALLEVIKSMHSDLGINSLMFTITQRAHKLVDADRCSFFLCNHKKNELWMMQGDIDLRIPMTAGVAGSVATTGEIANIPDAYEDSRFNKAVDADTGYRTKTILCMPLKGADGTTIAVIQLINKVSGIFTDEDIEIINSFLTIAGPILETSQLFQSRNKSKETSGSEFSGATVKRTQSAGAASFSSSMIIEEGDEEESDED